MHIPESDEHTPDVLDDTYVDKEIALPRDGDGPEFARVTKRIRDNNGMPVGVANVNPYLDTRIYEVEFIDGHKASLAANTIAECMWSQIDEEGNRHVLFDSIIDHRTNGREIKKKDAFIISPNGGKRRIETTKGHEILLQWKDGSTTWEAMKDIKECYSVQLAEYAIQNNIQNDPAYAWWVPHVIKKRERIISKVKSNYWTRRSKYGFTIPRDAKEAEEEDTRNGNT